MTPAHAELNGISADAASTLISIIGCADMLSRLSVAVAVDRGVVSIRRVFDVSLLLNTAGMVGVSLTASLGYWPLAVSCCVSAACAGCFMSLTPLLLAEVAGVARLRSSYAFVLFAMGSMNLTVPYGYGVLRDVTGTWNTSYYVAAAGSAAVGLLCMFAMPASVVISDRKDAKINYSFKSNS